MVFRETEVDRNFTQADAQKLVGSCMRYDSEILLEAGNRKINAKSLMGVISLALKTGDSITVIVKGDDQEEALNAAIRALSGK